MSSRQWSIIAAFLALAVVACSSSTKVPAAGGDKGTVIVPVKPDAKSAYKLPDFQEKRLDNGLQLLFVPDKRLPYVSYSLLIRAGAVQDPPELSGLASMVAELLDKGTKKRGAPQIAADLGQMGADFDASASVEYSVISASGLSTQAEPLLKNLLEIVTQPTFTDHEIERQRQQFLSAIERQVDNPEAFANLAFNAFLYGSEPYARSVTGNTKSIQAIKKKHIIQHYLKYFRPNNAILAVIGNFTPELATQVEKDFGSWQPREVSPPKFGEPPAIKGLQVELVDKPGLVQSQIRMGHIGIARLNDDFLPIRVANTILGGAFASRLNNRVRKELGLTYGVSSAFEPRLSPGPFEISTFSKNATAGQTVSESLSVLSQFKDQGVTGDELEMAKGYLKGVFPQAIETPEKLVFNLMLLRFYGVPDSYLTNYLTDVDRLTLSDVNRAIKKYFDDRNIKVVVYSNAADVKSQLETLVKEKGGELILKKPADVQ